MVAYRVENKYLISDLEMAVLAQRLGTVMERDEHQDGDCYEIRSIYFDDIWDSCMDENEAGVDCRNKYRIRTYGADSSVLRLEIKEKCKKKKKKRSCQLDNQTYSHLLWNSDGLDFGTQAALNQFLLQIRGRQLRPKVVIAYQRTAFVHASGNVRITFDRNIMASPAWDCFLQEQIPDLIPVLPTGLHVLEVKYDDFLPDLIAKQLEIGRLRQTAFSKYYLGRLALRGDFPVGY